MNKKTNIAVAVYIWVVAIIWFIDGYMYGTLNAFDSITDWAKEKWRKLKGEA